MASVGGEKKSQAKRKMSRTATGDNPQPLEHLGRITAIHSASGPSRRRRRRSATSGSRRGRARRRAAGTVTGRSFARKSGRDRHPTASILLNPWMEEGVFERNSLIRIILQQSSDEILGAAGDVRGEMQVDGLNAPVGVHLRGAFEGRFTDQKLVGQNAERPVVHALVVRLIFHHFRRQIVQRAAERFATRGRRVDGPAEVGDFHLLAQAEQQVFRLDVAMNDFLGMTVNHGVEEFGHVGRRPWLVELALGLQHFVQFSLGGEFQDQIHASFVVEIAVKTQDVGVAEVGLNLDFAAQLMLHVSLREGREKG